MENIELKDFQENIVKDLKLLTLSSIKKEILIQSPTGSGKTIFLISFIEEYLKEMPNTAFFWLTPGDGNLEEQSAKKMEKYLPDNSSKFLKDILVEGIKFGDTCFINWEVITKKVNTALKETEKKNLFDRIKEGKNANCNYIVIVDEEDKNDTPKANAIIDFINPEYIIRVSATTKKREEAEFLQINDTDVIKSGLITRALFINEGVMNNSVLKNEHEYLIDLAIKKRKLIRSEYVKNNYQVNPLIIIQFPNNSDDLIRLIEKYLNKFDINYKNKSLAIWMSEKKENIEKIEDNEAEPIVLLMKQAISTGWDCPRAKILVKLRTNMSEDFETQTLGRIRRMPQGHHYDNVLLDNCYLYTLDKKYEETIKEELGKSASDSKIIFLKKDYKSFKLKSQTYSRDIDDYDERYTFNLIYSYLKSKYNLSEIIKDNIIKLEANNFNFENKILNNIVQDKIVSIDNTKITQAHRINVMSVVDRKKNSYEMIESISNISKKIGIRNDRLRVILEKLFYKGRHFSKKILNLKLDEFYAFIINNNEILSNDFEEASSQRVSQEKMKLNYINEFDWHFPEKDYIKYNKNSKNKSIIKKETYDEYPVSVLGSRAEKMFEEFCENNNKVIWFHKNGESSSEYFSIVYINAVNKYKHFYPDFIVKDCYNKIWIIETKGGEDNEGKSKNIDENVENKFYALKKYATEHNLNFAFVRDMDEDINLYYCNTEYTEEMGNDNWTIIDKMFEQK